MAVSAGHALRGRRPGRTWRQYRPSGCSGPLPRWNQNIRYTFEDDLSWTKGRHNFKFGFVVERDSKTEPGSNDYAGVYNFGHSADNPLSTGNGYANALLGVFTSYTERDKRIDREDRHWQWVLRAGQLAPDLAADAGLRPARDAPRRGLRGRATRTRRSTRPLWIAGKPAALLPAVLPAERRAGQPRPAPRPTGRRSTRSPARSCRRRSSGTVVPGTGDITNGQFTGGLAPARRDGWYYDMPTLS